MTGRVRRWFLPALPHRQAVLQQMQQLDPIPERTGHRVIHATANDVKVRISGRWQAAADRILRRIA